MRFALKIAQKMDDQCILDNRFPYAKYRIEWPIFATKYLEILERYFR